MNEQQVNDLSSILATMAAVAHELDHDADQKQRLQTMEVFGSMIDTVLSGNAKA